MRRGGRSGGGGGVTGPCGAEPVARRGRRSVAGAWGELALELLDGGGLLEDHLTLEAHLLAESGEFSGILGALAA